MAEVKATKENVLKAWSDKVGKVDQYDLRITESQTQLIDKDTGSLTVAVDGTDQKALQTLLDRCGDTFIDGGESPEASTGDKSQVQFTSRGSLATPTQPEAMVSTQEPVEVTNEPGKTSEASAPVDRQPSQERVQLTGDGGTKSLGKVEGAQRTEGEVARSRGLSKEVAKEQKKKGGNTSSAEQKAAENQQPNTEE